MLVEADILQALMQWRTRVSAAAWVVVRDAHAAEDIFQNVVLKALTREVNFPNEAALMSWAFITARREGLDWRRRHQRESLGLNSELLDAMEGEWQAEPSLHFGARMEALQDCLESAPESARQLLKLRYYEGCSCEQVAERMGLGLNAIYKRVSRLHETLRDCVEGKLRTATNAGTPGE